MRSLFSVTLALLLAASLVSCTCTYRLNGPNTLLKIPCEGELNGLVPFKAWSTGDNLDKTQEEVEQYAVEAILFKTLTGSISQPLLDNEADAKRNYPVFFEDLIKKGMYKRYIVGRTRGLYGSGVKVRYEFSVNRAALKGDLQARGVIRRFGI